MDCGLSFFQEVSDHIFIIFQRTVKVILLKSFVVVKFYRYRLFLFALLLQTHSYQSNAHSQPDKPSALDKFTPNFSK